MANNTKKNVTLKSEQDVVGRYSPDLLYCTNETHSPSVEELVFLGKENLQRLLSDCRREERKLRKEVASLTGHVNLWNKVNSTDLKAYRSTYDPDIVLAVCNWYNARALFVEAERGKSSPKAFSCRFGPYVAKWCPVNPVRTNCSCCEQLGVCLPEEQPMPFLDRPCIICDGDEKIFNEVRVDLEKQLSATTLSKDLTQAYVSRITIAKTKAEAKPIFAAYRDANYLRPHDELLYLKLESPTDYIWMPGEVVKVDSSPSTGLTAIKVRFLGNSRATSLDLNDSYLLRMDDAKYLVEHEDFMEIWCNRAFDFLRPYAIKPFKGGLKKYFAG